MTNEELAIAIQGGNDALTGELWERCKGFICKEATRWARAFESRPDIDVDDLIQSGYIALINAVQGFDAGKGTFLTLLGYTLKSAFADACGVRTQAQRQDPIKSPLRFESPISYDDDLELGDTIADQRNGIEEVEEAIYSDYVSKTVHNAVDNLKSKQQREVINQYYFRGKTHKEIADCLALSCSRAQQIEKEGLRSLRASRHIPALSEIYYGTRNYYRGTGYLAFKYSGSSSPEMELLIKERIENQYLKRSRKGKIALLLRELGCSIEQAQVIATLDSVTA